MTTYFSKDMHKKYLLGIGGLCIFLTTYTFFNIMQFREEEKKLVKIVNKYKKTISTFNNKIIQKKELEESNEKFNNILSHSEEKADFYNFITKISEEEKVQIVKLEKEKIAQERIEQEKENIGDEIIKITVRGDFFYVVRFVYKLSFFDLSLKLNNLKILKDSFFKNNVLGYFWFTKNSMKREKNLKRDFNSNKKESPK